MKVQNIGSVNRTHVSKINTFHKQLTRGLTKDSIQSQITSQASLEEFDNGDGLEESIAYNPVITDEVWRIRKRMS